MTADELLELVADYGYACVNVGYCTEEPVSADPEASNLYARIEAEVKRLHRELDELKQKAMEEP